MALVKCPECKGKVSDSALLCPHCGFNMGVWIAGGKNKQKSARKPGRLGRFVLYGALAVVAILALGEMSSKNKDIDEGGAATATTETKPKEEESTGTYTVKRDCGTKTEAFVMSQSFVKQQLRSPSTADFPYSNKASIVPGENCTYAVASYVDAQNGFGATVRSKWYTVVQYFATKDEWRLLSVGID